MIRYCVGFTIILIYISFKGFAQDSEKGKVYNNTEQSPDYPGGIGKLYVFIRENMNYPQEAIDQKIEGVVYVEMVIDTNGNAENIIILKDIGGGCGDEAKRLMEIMPNWIPGKQNGKIIPVKIKLPIRFYLPEPEKPKRNKKAKNNKK